MCFSDDYDRYQPQPQIVQGQNGAYAVPTQPPYRYPYRRGGLLGLGARRWEEDAAYGGPEYADRRRRRRRAAFMASAR